MKKNKIRPYYQELQGYLSQTPQPKSPYRSLESSESWEQVNGVVDSINEITGKDYSRFKIVPKNSGSSASVNHMTFRQKLAGLIDTLHAEYFSDEQRPFSGSPSTVISQHQSQKQNLNVSMVLEIQEKVINRLNQKEITPKEKKFLETVKGRLANVKSWLELINLITSAAKSVGMSIDKLESIFR